MTRRGDEPAGTEPSPPPSADTSRRALRVRVDDLSSRVEIEGRAISGEVIDFSADGMRIRLPPGAAVRPDDSVRVAVGQQTPTIEGRVRWVEAAPSPATSLDAGIAFDNCLLVLEQKEHSTEEVLHAWRDIAHTWGIYEAYLQIQDEFDAKALDGDMHDVAAAVGELARWLDEVLGPLNLWSRSTPTGSTDAPQLVAPLHAVSGASLEARGAAAARALRESLTVFEEGRVYLHGDSLVVEYVGDDVSHVDLLQKLAIALGARLSFWSRLVLKNQTLRVLSEELERHKHSR